MSSENVDEVNTEQRPVGALSGLITRLGMDLSQRQTEIRQAKMYSFIILLLRLESSNTSI